MKKKALSFPCVTKRDWPRGEVEDLTQGHGKGEEPVRVSTSQRSGVELQAGAMRKRRSEALPSSAKEDSP